MKDEQWPIGMSRCFYCGELSDVIIAKTNTAKSRREMEQIDRMVVGMNPCSTCEGYMKDNIILITIDESKSDKGWEHPGRGNLPHPYRTGGFFVVKEDAFVDVLTARGADQSIIDMGVQHRWMFIEHEAAVSLGLFNSVKEDEDG